MPSIMMEKKLLYLHEKLAQIVSDDSKNYQKIFNAGLRLAEKRTAVLADEKMDMLVAEFEKSIEDPILQNYRNMGKIIVSSVIEKWLTDNNKFSDEWIKAVKRTAQEARNLINA